MQDPNMQISQALQIPCLLTPKEAVAKVRKSRK
jgi:hypothetical protein